MGICNQSEMSKILQISQPTINRNKSYFLIEKWRYIDTINDYNSMIEEFQKLYEQTSTTQRYACARIPSGLKQSKRLKTQKYKARTAISK